MMVDYYVFVMFVDVLKLKFFDVWKVMSFFRQLNEFEGIFVINVYFWFDCKLCLYDGFVFSCLLLFSVYVDMFECCVEYKDDDRFMFEFVFASCDKCVGFDVNWIGVSDEDIVVVMMKEFEMLFLDEFGVGKDGVLGVKF